MKAMSDFDLLRDYVEHRSEPSFAALVEKYVNLVYSTALRQVWNAPLAEEVTQMGMARHLSVRRWTWSAPG